MEKIVYVVYENYRTDKEIVVAVCDTEEKAIELIAKYGDPNRLYTHEKLLFNEWCWF